MELKIISEKENPLMSRKEIRAQFSGFSVSPARTDVSAKLAEHYKVDASTIHVVEVHCPYGGVLAVITAYIYKDAASLTKFTPAKRMLRGVKKEPKKKK